MAARPVSLRRAASIVFALAAILPILVFVYLLSRTDLLRRPEAQASVVMAILVAAVGFVVLRWIVNQFAGLADSLRASLAETITVPRATSVPAIGEVAEIGQVAGALQHLLDNLREATQRLEDLVFKLGTLNEMVELASQVPKIRDLLALVLQSTMRAVRATAGSIMILDPERHTLQLAASRGTLDPVLLGGDVKVGEGIAGAAVAAGQPLLVDDMAADPRFSPPSAPPHEAGSFLCMPIRVGDRVIGAINLARSAASGTGVSLAPRPFGAVDLQFLNALMTYIGYAVENTRLLDEARQSAQQLQEAVEDLKATQSRLVRGETLRALGQLSSGVAHHLNNLFAVILGRTELLLRGVDDARVRRALDVIQRSAQDGADVVRRVQRFSRTQPVSAPVAVDLNQIVDEVVELTRPHWASATQLQGGRGVEVLVEPGPIPPVAGEPTSLREAVMNLLLNAVEAVPGGGTVTIKTWRAEDQVYCAVADTGAGMSEDVRRRAVEPFFTTKGPKNTGLGLSVAHGTMQRHNGVLTIESDEGRGTTVTFSLPVATGSAVAEAPPAAPPPPRAPLRILLIDDELQVRAILADLLRAEGHTVVEAPGGRQGLGCLEAGEQVDLVLTDLGMPEMTGADVAQAIRSRWPQLPVGLVTGWGEQELTREERARVSFVLAKPFDSALLREALSRLHLPALGGPDR